MATSRAASASTHRSPSTLRISGCSTRRFPNALRCAQWCAACHCACRSMPAAPITQSSRVWFTISRMVGTPRPSSPKSRAQAPSSSTSLEALERLPSLSLRRCRKKRFRAPSGVQRGKRKQERPRGACARTRNASLIGAEQNHLCPVRRHALPSCAARVVLARTSEPPCFSVIAMPISAPDFPAAGNGRGS